jgi:hypothetical protein
MANAQKDKRNNWEWGAPAAEMYRIRGILSQMWTKTASRDITQAMDFFSGFLSEIGAAESDDSVSKT